MSISFVSRYNCVSTSVPEGVRYGGLWVHMLFRTESRLRTTYAYDCLSDSQRLRFNKRGPWSFASVLNSIYILITENGGGTKKAVSNTDIPIPLGEKYLTHSTAYHLTWPKTELCVQMGTGDDKERDRHQCRISNPDYLRRLTDVVLVACLSCEPVYGLSQLLVLDLGHI